jgi:hypothetical protein
MQTRSRNGIDAPVKGPPNRGSLLPTVLLRPGVSTTIDPGTHRLDIAHLGTGSVIAYDTDQSQLVAEIPSVRSAAEPMRLPPTLNRSHSSTRLRSPLWAKPQATAIRTALPRRQVSARSMFG